MRRSPRMLMAAAVLWSLLWTTALASDATGVVGRSVVSLHRWPSLTSECVTQALMGEPLHITAVRGSWLKVTLPQQCDYSGWIESSAVCRGQFVSLVKRVQIKSAAARVYQKADRTSAVLTEVYLSTALQCVEGAPDGWVCVRLPDGRTGFVPSVEVDLHPPRLAASVVLTVARKYLGTRYVWGGMSARGIDCSGLTHTVYRYAGVRLHRDADQQFALDGRPVVSETELRPGDLVFFKGRSSAAISHVGFYLGAGRILHASSRSGAVSFADLSEPYLHSRYAGARRILP